MIRHLGSNYDAPWTLVGDFNEILYETKKRGGATSDCIEIQRFRAVINKLGLRDVRFDGYPYTWSK